MSIEIDMEQFAGTDPIYDIASEVFAAMIDGEPGLLRVWDGIESALVDEIHAWVDVHGPISGRVLLTTERSTALAVTRALLAMAPDEPVDDSDIVDALGEVANVVGGNVKALVPDPGALTLPQVTHERPATDPDALLHRLVLDWRGRPLIISLWQLP
ncbi:chemotaxis protein CheX [Cellulomonas sp. KRMCY2]|uniref:chemotaxis protein CheX n=1 Tax=Cellulomonas sp. KRMCY2 TaxID=1304865 RepID=UPI00045E8DBD|nr:chemotaxis protein CheX [Cellulomonas sp. KRMCY2]